MYKGKHIKRNNNRLRGWKKVVLFAAFVVIMTSIVAGTIAFLIARSEKLMNTFTVPESGLDIQETFDGGSKKDVYFANGSEYPVFMRAKYVAYLKDGDGNISPMTPEFATESINTTDWSLNTSDGYYYYNKIVAANDNDPATKDDVTSNFINEITPDYKDVPTGYYLVVDVIVETVQATPTTAAQELWGFTPGVKEVQE